MRSFDFGLNWKPKDVKEKFVDLLQKACKEMGMSFYWVCSDNVREVIKNLENKKLHIKALLDTEASYNIKSDLYSRVCYLVKDNGGAVINDPDRTKNAIDKSVIHFELINEGVTAPYTIVVRNWEPKNFKLKDEEKKRLGVPFVIKPALGFGQMGVLKEARGTIREIANARNFDRGDNFLLQEKIFPIELSGKRAWFRVFNLFDAVIPCWWDDQQNKYEHVSYEEFNSCRLYPLAKIVTKISALTRMAWFSTEIAIDKKFGPARFVAIDYVNDQCDMSMKCETTSGVPDPIVEYTARSIVKTAYRYINKEKLSRKYTIWLKDATVELRGLGDSQELVRSKL